MKPLTIALWLLITICPLTIRPAFAAEPARNQDLTNELPAGFVDIRTIVPDVVLDIRYYSDHNFIGERIDGYHAPKCILTKQAAEALAGVQAELRPQKLSLKIYDGYRPQRSVNHFVRWAKDGKDTRMKAEFYPDLDKKDLFPMGYIASRSGHSRGSTVDLTLVPVPAPGQEEYRSGMPLRPCYAPTGMRFGDNSLDMGTGFDCFSDLSHTANPAVSEVAKKNRQLLKSIMKKHGFENYSKEWWHYSLKQEPFPKTYFDFPVR